MDPGSTTIFRPPSRIVSNCINQTSRDDFYIFAIFILVLHPFSNQKIWLGLTDTAVESVFRWFDGSVITWVNWTPGQPDGSVSANCVVRQQDGKWMDEGCENQFQFYCEEEG